MTFFGILCLISLTLTSVLSTNTTLKDHVGVAKRTATAYQNTANSTKDYGRKSREKCRKYDEWLTGPTLNDGDEEKECGIRVKLIGGERADELEFPHLVRLGYPRGDIISWMCMGSLISDQYILTAAHCVQTRNELNLTYVRLGTGKPSSRIQVKISEKIIHPEYKVPGFYNDIALVKLERPLERFSNYMRPACLQTDRQISQRTATEAGWKSSETEIDEDDYLIARVQPLISHSECSKIYQKNRRLFQGIDDEIMICAGGRPAKEECLRNSGGPLQVINESQDCMYNIIGVISFGLSCYLSVPFVAVRVSTYVPWIESIVWPDESKY